LALLLHRFITKYLIGQLSLKNFRKGKVLVGETFAQKILAKKSEKTRVEEDQFIRCRVDGLLANDTTSRLMLESFNKMNRDIAEMPEGCSIYFDHYTPPPSQDAAINHKIIREFCYTNNITLYDVGRGSHLHVPIEVGQCRPGMLFVGADSHTTVLGGIGAFATGVGSTDLASVLATGELWFRVPPVIKIELKGQLSEYVVAKDVMLEVVRRLTIPGGRYKALEFTGEAAKAMSIESRLAIASMAVDIGAKVGFFEADEKTEAYIKEYTDKSYDYIKSDPDANYEQIVSINVSEIEPLVAIHPRIDNVCPVSELKNTIEVDEVYLGSCTNGRLEDLEVAAKMLKGKSIHQNIRLVVAPQSQIIFNKALEKGIIKQLSEAGAIILPCGCGPCSGTHLGVLAPEEKVLSTGSRNAPGRMGSGKSQIFVASPVTAAATAISGKIEDPRKIGWGDIRC